MLVMSDLFPSDPEAEVRSRAMNDLIVRGARRKTVFTGGADRLSGIPPENARMNAALGNLERAEREGADDTTLAILSDQLDQAIDSARDARQQRARDPETGQFVPAGSFDGGVRGVRREKPTPGFREESPTDLMLRAMQLANATRAA